MCLTSRSEVIKSKFKDRKIAYKVFKLHKEGGLCSVYRNFQTELPQGVWIDEFSRRSHLPDTLKDTIAYSHPIQGSYPAGFHCYLVKNEALMAAKYSREIGIDVETYQVQIKHPLAYGIDARSAAVVVKEIKIAKGAKPCKRIHPVSVRG